nr:DEAD/DEAH box helicase family protein [Streptococcus saliviloxodontae]
MRYGLKPSDSLSLDTFGNRPAYNLTIEMETGTGKTYTYIRTIMELHKRYGWLKFIIVVPSIAIREGVLKSFEVMADHFQSEYGTKPRYFVYNSSRLSDLDLFANSSDLRVMIINAQAFNAKGKDARRIHMELENFRYRKPIDVLAATNPIMIIDEPQSVEGKATKERLADFKPLMTLRYSATHKENYDMLYRLDALDAYNQKLVKKIAVKAIEQSGSTGTTGYLRLLDLLPQKSGSPKARIEFEILTKAGKIKRQTRIVTEPFDLYAESNQMEAYRDGFTLSHFDAREDEQSIQVGANQKLYVGQVMGLMDENHLRRLQISETIKTHLEKEEILYKHGIKVLSLFFIDEVAKYKAYDEDNNPLNGDYAQFFEEEYQRQVRDYIASHEASSYRTYLEGQQEASQAHAGYFSIDKVKKSDKTVFVDYKSATERKKAQSNDQDAYDLIMKDKERLLSFDEPVRFIFSHSALKEGWDNPNVFQICTLKDSSAETRKRQEIGRGMRLSVDQKGVRQDYALLGEAVHEINKLTVIANESYDSFTRSLQTEMLEELKDRPKKVTVELFVDKILTNSDGDKLTVTKEVADKVHFELIKQGYIDSDYQLTDTFHKAKEKNQLVFSETVTGFEGELLNLLDTVYTGEGYVIENANKASIRFADEVNQENLSKAEFQKLWETINRKSSYRVTFDDAELISKATEAITNHLVVSQPSYQIVEAAADKMTEQGLGFAVSEQSTADTDQVKPKIQVRYDLLGELSDVTGLTRRTVAEILSKIAPYQFDKFKVNPEEFIIKVGRLINEQKARQIIQHIEYHILEESFDTSIFTDNEETAQLADKHLLESEKGIYNYVKVDSEVEATFKDALEQQADVKVYVKLPRKFVIPTPLGDYNPDWAIAFKEGSVKHVYFVAETKGSMSSLQLKASEESKINCARAHFKKLKESGMIQDNHIYDVVDSYEQLLAIVKS